MSDPLRSVPSFAPASHVKHCELYRICNSLLCTKKNYQKLKQSDVHFSIVLSNYFVKILSAHLCFCSSFCGLCELSRIFSCLLCTKKHHKKLQQSDVQLFRKNSVSVEGGSSAVGAGRAWAAAGSGGAAGSLSAPMDSRRGMSACAFAAFRKASAAWCGPGAGPLALLAENSGPETVARAALLSLSSVAAAWASSVTRAAVSVSSCVVVAPAPASAG